MTLPPAAPVPPSSYPSSTSFPPPVPRPASPTRALPRDATEGGLAFHRLLFARRRSGWWTPLVVGALGIAFYVVALVIVLVIVIAAASADPTILDRMLALSENPAVDASDPFMFTLLVGTIVVMLPCYLLASLVVNGRRIGLTSSAAGRVRWTWMLQCALIALVPYAVVTAISLLLPSDQAATGTPNPQWVLSLILVLVLVPFQSAAEEYIFRGYLAQSIGRWLRHPAWAILLPVPLFVMGHTYDVLGQIGVGLFAVSAGWLTWRTGGLEAAIALHVINNLSGFLMSLATGTDPTASETGIVSFITSFVLMGGYVGIVEWMLRRRAAQGRALPRTLVLTPAPAPAVAAPGWAAPGLAAPPAEPGPAAPPAGPPPLA